MKVESVKRTLLAVQKLLRQSPHVRDDQTIGLVKLGPMTFGDLRELLRQLESQQSLETEG